MKEQLIRILNAPEDDIIYIFVKGEGAIEKFNCNSDLAIENRKLGYLEYSCGESYFNEFDLDYGVHFNLTEEEIYSLTKERLIKYNYKLSLYRLPKEMLVDYVPGKEELHGYSDRSRFISEVIKRSDDTLSPFEAFGKWSFSNVENKTISNKD